MATKVDAAILEKMNNCVQKLLAIPIIKENGRLIAHFDEYLNHKEKLGLFKAHVNTHIAPKRDKLDEVVEQLLVSYDIYPYQVLAKDKQIFKAYLECFIDLCDPKNYLEEPLKAVPQVKAKGK